MNRYKVLGCLTGLSLVLFTSTATAQMPMDASSQFQRIEQPIALKMGVAAGGLVLIGLELWWFLGSKPANR
jgi:plastocyanin domain-containing protein